MKSSRGFAVLAFRSDVLPDQMIVLISISGRYQGRPERPFPLSSRHSRASMRGPRHCPGRMGKRRHDRWAQ